MAGRRRKFEIGRPVSTSVGGGEARHFRQDLVVLLLCLGGLVGLVYVFLTIKQGGTLPREVFVGSLALACAPFFIALFRPPKILYLIPGTVVVFLLYGVAAPYGYVYTHDPIFNLQFSADVVRTGIWTPGVGTLSAYTYTYYPLSNVFVSVVAIVSGRPLSNLFLWAEPVVRMVVLPASVYAIGRRFFDARAAALGLAIYMGSASTHFNLPVQQGMSVVFFALSLLSIVLLASEHEPSGRRRVQALLVLTSTAVVMTHSWSAYVLGVWLAALVGLPLIARIRAFPQGLRLGWTLARYIGTVLIYVLGLAFTVARGQSLDFLTSLSEFVQLQTPPSRAAGLGGTFSSLEIAWIVGSIAAIALLTVLAVRILLTDQTQGFAAANGLASALLLVLFLPLIATSLLFLALRISEFANIVAAPLTAWMLIRFAHPENSTTGAGLPMRIGRPAAGWLRRHPAVLASMVVIIAAAIIMGGSMVPLSTRIYFDPLTSRRTDSAIFIGPEAMRAEQWASVHLAGGRIWGDDLALSVFSGFAGIPMRYGQYSLFNNTTLDTGTWDRLLVGDYVVLDVYMTLLQPHFFDRNQPPGPLDPRSVQKFGDDPHFALVYEDSTFTIYRVTAKP